MEWGLGAIAKGKAENTTTCLRGGWGGGGSVEGCACVRVPFARDAVPSLVGGLRGVASVLREGSIANPQPHISCTPAFYAFLRQRADGGFARAV